MGRSFNVKMHRGAPAIFVDGDPLTGLMYMCAQGSASWREDLLAMNEAGIKVLNNGPQPVLTHDGRGDELDLEATDRSVHELLEGGIYEFDIKFYHLGHDNPGDYLVIDFIRAEAE